MKHWHIIQQQPKLKKIFNQLLIVSYGKKKSLKDILVCVKILSLLQQSQNRKSDLKQTTRQFAYNHLN